ncbi:MAG: NAD(P)-dependent dehydrogenase (short-subunit alcohol dehydrogenase family) [Flavobacterium sp.]|jgi:NAD(P)-dependent dehydrogenase (short-subunit alcohol dehydrogenase family)
MKNKVVIITGASRGIGAATALLFAKKGFDVCVNYLTHEEAALDIKKQIEEMGQQAIAVKADVSKESEVIRLFTEVDKNLGDIQSLVNNAGILFTQSPLAGMSEERINKVFNTNVIGYFLCCKEAIKRMTYRGVGGTIVNVSSAASRLGAPGEYIDYAASKGAIDTLTIGLSKEVASEGIRVNCVRPGYIYTDMHTDGGEPNRVDRLKQDLPMQRGGQVEEVAAAIYWLASEESSYTTGSFTEVAGGR